MTLGFDASESYDSRKGIWNPEAGMDSFGKMVAIGRP